eukprot:gene1758-527_t
MEKENKENTEKTSPSKRKRISSDSSENESPIVKKNKRNSSNVNEPSLLDEQEQIEVEEEIQLEEGMTETQNFMYGFTTNLSKEKEEEILTILKGNDEGKQFEAISELCNFFSMADPDTISTVRYREYTPLLLQILADGYNFELMLLATRALTNMIDSCPPTSSQIVSNQGVSILIVKLLNIEFIDLAEQCIQCLYFLSETHGIVLLKQGVLSASLMFFDFFGIHVQKNVLKMAVNLCKRIPHDGFDLFQTVLPNLTNLLSYQDETISQNACKCFLKAALNIQNDEKKILLMASEGLVDQLFQLAKKKPTLNEDIVYIWTILARGSNKLVTSLLENGIIDVIDKFFNHEDQKNSKLKQKFPIAEMVSFIKDMNPRTNVFTSNMSLESRKFLFQSLVEPELPEDIIDSKSKKTFNTREEILKDNKVIYLEYVKVILPLIIKTYTSNMNQSVKLNCLTIIGTIIYYCSEEMLKEILMDIPISSFLTRLLGSNDLIFISTGIQISEILIQKLPDIFSIYFVREGVTNEIKKICGDEKGEITLLDEMKKKTKIAFDVAIENYRISLQETKDEKMDEEKITTENSEDSQKETKKTLDLLNHITKGIKNLNKPEKEKKGQFQKPFVEAPEIPFSSRIAESRDSFKNPELLEFVVSSAQQFRNKNLLKNDFESNICKSLREVGEELLELMEQPNEDDETELLNKIAAILISDEGISTFEFLDSGIIKVLSIYLQDKSKLHLFLNIFDKEAQIQHSISSPMPLFDKSAYSIQDGSPLPGTESPSIVGSPASTSSIFNHQVTGSPSSYSASPFRSSSLKSSPFKSKRENTYLIEFVKKIQNCLTQSENLPLIIKETNSLFFGLTSVLGIVSKEFRIQIQSLDNKDMIFKDVEVSPLERIKIISEMIPELENSINKEVSVNLRDDPSFGGFTIEEDEEDEQISITEIKLEDEMKQEEEQEEYYYLKKIVKKEQVIEDEYTFYLNGKPLNPNMNIFNSIYSYGNKGETFAPRHPSNLNLWDNTYTLTYEKTKKEIPKTTGLTINEETLNCLNLLKLIFDSSKKIEKKHFRNEKISAKLTRQINDPLMLFTNTLPKWCFSLTKSHSFIFPYSLRKNLFDLTSLGVARSLKIMEEKIDKGKIIHIERKKLKVEREKIFQFANEIFNKYGLSRCILEYQYKDEVGVGLGPTIEFYSLVSKEFKKSKLNIWINDNDDEYVSNSFGLFPKIIDFKNEKELLFNENVFKFMGLFVARGIFDFKLLDLPFSNEFLKLVFKNKELVFDDLKFIYPSIYEMIRKLKRDELTEEQIENLYLTFTVPGYDKIELKKNGNEIEVNKSNVTEYIDLVLEFLLKNGISKQIKSFKFGFQKLINLQNLNSFSILELNKLINGEQQVLNENILLSYTKCDFGYTNSSKVIKNLFQVLSEFDLDSQRLFLQFVTGSSQLPVGGLAYLKPKLTIVRKLPETNQLPDDLLPSCMTCTNYLKLPEYTTKDILKKQLIKAITEGQGSFHLS